MRITPHALLPDPPQWLDRRWKRHVRGRPDRYRVVLDLPTVAPSGESLLGAAVDHVERLRLLARGRVDVDGTDGLVAETDPVPAGEFDGAALDALVAALSRTYGDAFDVTTIETWRYADCGLVKSVVVVPVRPLFPATAEATAAST
jgi:hypothetical protein